MQTKKNLIRFQHVHIDHPPDEHLSLETPLTKPSNNSLYIIHKQIFANTPSTPIMYTETTRKQQTIYI